MRRCDVFPTVEGLEEVVGIGVSDGVGESGVFEGCVGRADDDCATVTDPDVGADLDQTPHDAMTV
jgi:hypothetical protein